MKFVILFCLLTYFFSAVYRIYHFPYFHAWMTFHVWKVFFFSFLVLHKWGQNIYKIAVRVFPNCYWGCWKRKVEIYKYSWCWRSFLFFQLHWSEFYRWHQKLLIIGPDFFFSTANWPKSSPHLNSCSIKISHRGTSL